MRVNTPRERRGQTCRLRSEDRVKKKKKHRKKHARLPTARHNSPLSYIYTNIYIDETICHFFFFFFHFAFPLSSLSLLLLFIYSFFFTTRRRDIPPRSPALAQYNTHIRKINNIPKPAKRWSYAYTPSIRQYHAIKGLKSNIKFSYYFITVETRLPF